MITKQVINQPEIKRILLAYSSDSISDDIIESAILLATNLQAELMGLFIEDIKLLHLSALPIASEVIYGSMNRQKLDPDSVERAFKLQAERFRKRLETAATKADIHVSIMITRGVFSDRLFVDSSTGDLLIIGRPSFTHGEHVALKKRATPFIRAPGSVTLLKQGLQIQQAIFVLFENVPSGKRTLHFACKLAHTTQHPLTIILPGLEPDDDDSTWQAANLITCQYPINASYTCLAEQSLESLLEQIRHHRAQLLILDAKSKRWNKAKQRELIAFASCPVVLSR